MLKYNSKIIMDSFKKTQDADTACAAHQGAGNTTKTAASRFPGIDGLVTGIEQACERRSKAA